MPVGGDTGRRADATRFTRALDDLERQGGAVLVVGSVPDDSYERVSERLLGGDGATSHRRLLVSETTASDRLSATGPTTPEFARLVAYCGGDDENSSNEASSREGGPAGAEGPSSNATDPSAVSPSAVTVHRVGPSLAELGTAVTDVLDQFDAAAGGLAAAELRVAFDPLAAMLAEYDLPTVFRFLHVVTNQVRARCGVAHFRLPNSIEDRSVRALRPLFDAVVELGLDGDGPRQRWHAVDGVAAEKSPRPPDGDE